MNPASAPLPLVAARIVVGLPLRNEARFLPETLEALAGQDLRDFRVLISDNASDDDSPALCRAMAARDARFHYVRQADNIGAARNFAFCLDHSASEYFMWCGAHDVISTNFLSSMARALDDDAGLTLAFGTREAIDERSGRIEAISRDQGYRYRLLPGRHLRYLQAACALSECTIVNGLFRRRCLDGFEIAPVFACDKALLSRILFQGRLAYRQEAVYRRRYFEQRTETQIERIKGAPAAASDATHEFVDFLLSDLAVCMGEDARLPGSWRRRAMERLLRTRFLAPGGRHLRTLARLSTQPMRTLKLLGRA